jgi:hypothetical protein
VSQFQSHLVPLEAMVGPRGVLVAQDEPVRVCPKIDKEIASVLVINES